MHIIQCINSAYLHIKTRFFPEIRLSIILKQLFKVFIYIRICASCTKMTAQNIVMNKNATKMNFYLKNA